MHNRHHPPIQLALPPPDIAPYLVAACAVFDDFIGQLGGIDARGVWRREASAQLIQISAGIYFRGFCSRAMSSAAACEGRVLQQ